MFGGHDINNGGALDSAELANSIESRYGMRQEATIDFRDNLVSEGVSLPLNARRELSL